MNEKKFGNDRSSAKDNDKNASRYHRGQYVDVFTVGHILTKKRRIISKDCVRTQDGTYIWEYEVEGLKHRITAEDIDD